MFDWLEVDEKVIDEEFEKEMEYVRKIVEVGLSVR